MQGLKLDVEDSSWIERDLRGVKRHDDPLGRGRVRLDGVGNTLKRAGEAHRQTAGCWTVTE